MTEYVVSTCEPDAPRNIDELRCDDAPPCPLCGSVYVGIMAHHGPGAAWVECFLGHCVRLDWDDDGRVHQALLTDKPRYTLGLSYEIVAASLASAGMGAG